MEGLANFADDLLGGVALIALSLAIGGVGWKLFVFRAGRPAAAARPFLGHCVSLLLLGAASLSVVQLIKLKLEPRFVKATEMARA